VFDGRHREKLQHAVAILHEAVRVKPKVFVFRPVALRRIETGQLPHGLAALAAVRIVEGVYRHLSLQAA
jgi:hypothetical protein